MLFRIFPFLVTTLFIMSSGQVTAQIKLINAQIVSKKDSNVVVGAHVVNMNTMNATYTYSDGTFLLPYTQGDTIRISHIEFEDKYIYTSDMLIPDAIQITIMLQKATYNLNQVDVQIYSDKEAFADDFKNREVETEAVEVFKYEGPEKLEDVGTDLNAHVPLGSPVTFLYNKFSKEAKEQKRLEQAKATTDRERTIKERYNVDVIKKVTGIKSDEEAEAFMKNCPLEDDYVYRSTDYDIVKSILQCQKDQKPK
ncbi:MAG: hypothetical protein ACPGEG_10195 [Salibacteraceae bacterium]